MRGMRGLDPARAEDDAGRERLQFRGIGAEGGGAWGGAGKAAGESDQRVVGGQFGRGALGGDGQLEPGAGGGGADLVQDGRAVEAAAGAEFDPAGGQRRR